MAENALIINNLSGGYPENKLFSNLSLSIQKGSFTAIVGPNGAGKSTFLKYIIRELESSDKSVSVLGTDINCLSQKELAKIVSFVGQSGSKDYEFTVSEIVSFGRYCHEDYVCNQKTVEDSMNSAEILPLKNRLITKISGGEFQLVMLARAICQETDIILLDEPSNNLDPYHQLLMMKLLKKLSDKGKTVICVMHDLNTVMSWFTDTIILKDGSVFAYGKTEEVLIPENIKSVYGIECELISQGCGKRPLIAYCSL